MKDYAIKNYKRSAVDWRFIIIVFALIGVTLIDNWGP